MSEYFRKADPSRLVHYESICWDRVNEASGKMVLAMPMNVVMMAQATWKVRCTQK